MEELKIKFLSVFDGKPSKGYDGYVCPIVTKPSKKVNIRYESIPQAYEEATKTAINELLEDLFNRFN